MNTQTLKKLIESESDRTETIEEFKEAVFRLIDLYSEDNRQPFEIGNTTDTVPYFTLCGCNPSNGGSGLCGCSMGNLMVKRKEI
jgi:hypothetical protein